MMANHPTLDELNDYILDPAGEEYRMLRRHLMFCSQCREQTGKLQLLLRQLAGTTPAKIPTQERTKGIPWLEILGVELKQLFAFKAPAWSLAVSVMLIGGLLLFFPQQRIISYSDSTNMTFEKSTAPGIQFFGQVFHQPYRGIDADYDGNRLRLNWPAVENAEQYTLEISSNVNGQKKILFNGSSQTNSILIDKLNLQAKQPYTWKLTGKTKDNLRFHQTGGLVTDD